MPRSWLWLLFFQGPSASSPGARGCTSPGSLQNLKRNAFRSKPRLPTQQANLFASLGFKVSHYCLRAPDEKDGNTEELAFFLPGFSLPPHLRLQLVSPSPPTPASMTSILLFTLCFPPQLISPTAFFLLHSLLQAATQGIFLKRCSDLAYQDIF